MWSRLCCLHDIRRYSSRSNAICQTSAPLRRVASRCKATRMPHTFPACSSFGAVWLWFVLSLKIRRRAFVERSFVFWFVIIGHGGIAFRVWTLQTPRNGVTGLAPRFALQCTMIPISTLALALWPPQARHLWHVVFCPASLLAGQLISRSKSGSEARRARNRR